MLSYISKHYKAIQIDSFEEFCKKIIESQAKSAFTNMKLYDTMVVFKKMSIGLDKPIYFYDNSGKICTLREISGVSEILQLDSDYLPVFYVYILLKEDDATIESKRDDFLRNIGNMIGHEIVKNIISTLESLIEQMEEELCAE